MTKTMKNNVTEVEEKLFYCMMGQGGSFSTRLFSTIFAADSINIVKLSLGFPEEVTVALRYRDESGYWEDLQKRMNNESN